MSRWYYTFSLLPFILTSPCRANCLTDVVAVKSAVEATKSYREIQSIRDKDGTIKTLVLDFKGEDKLRFSYYEIWGDIRVGVIVGSRLWDRGNDGKLTENTTSSESGIAHGMIKGKRFNIDTDVRKIKCSTEKDDFGEKVEKFVWTQKERSFSIDFTLWSDKKSHLPVRETWNYKGRPDIADSKATILFLFSNALTITEPD